MKKKKITREFLQKIGITRCENGQFYKGDFKIKYHKVWAIHRKSGNDKYYWTFTYYDVDLYQEQMRLYNEGKWVNKQGKPKSYKPNGISAMLVHRAVWAWYKGETPEEEDRNIDVCHYNDEVDNNDINNLYIDDHIGNIHARKVHTGGRIKKCQQNKN